MIKVVTLFSFIVFFDNILKINKYKLKYIYIRKA